LKYLRVGAFVAVGLALTSMLVNCRDRDVSTVMEQAREAPSDGEQVAIDHCVPGQTVACMGGCGAPSTGYQVCAADGGSFGSCLCPPLRTLGPLPSLATLDDDGEQRNLSRAQLMGGLAPDPRASAGPVGAACSKDADCLSGLDCLTADGGVLDFSGPAGGYCTVGCADDAACQAVDRGSECLSFRGQRICVRTCASGVVPSAVAKCLDRSDVTCVSDVARQLQAPADGPQPGVCLPSCQSDAQCGAGLFCDLRNGLCTNAPPTGDPVGSRCDGPNNNCEGGVCVPLNGFERFCSAFCRFGGPGCGFDGDDARPEAGCVLAQVPGESVGDRGLCLELCESASDCARPGAVCLATTAGSSTRVCVVPTPPAVFTPDPGTVVGPPDPGGPAAPPRTGNTCSGAAACGTGFECLTPDSDPFGLGGGFGGGYCSSSCAQGPCTEPGSVCVTVDPDSGGSCLRACDPQTGGDCGERSDLICIPFGNDATAGFCLPDCTAGADCGDRVCDPSLGLCVEGPPPGGGGPSEPPAEATTGNACSAAVECSGGFECLTPDLDPFGLGGGFGGGYCSASCADAPCAEPGSVCITTSAGGLCLRACNLQTGGACGERSELFCVPLSDDGTAGVCLPDCTAGTDCGDRVCDPSLGLCVDAPVAECSQDEDCTSPQICTANQCVAPTPGCASDAACAPGTCDPETQLCVATPTGCTTDAECGAQRCDTASGACVDATCTLDGDCPGGGVCNRTTGVCHPAPPIAVGGACTRNADCLGGRCSTLDGVTAFCSAVCSLGSDIGCEIYGSDAFCLLRADPSQPTLGRCLELCDASADCAQPGYECSIFGGTTIFNGRSGACVPAAPPPAAPPPAAPPSP
jgi:hypothetical protein